MYLDSLPFVWKRFEQDGYATLFAEDMPHLNALQSGLTGLEHIPTDHFMRYDCTAPSFYFPCSQFLMVPESTFMYLIYNCSNLLYLIYDCSGEGNGAIFIDTTCRGYNI